MSNALARLSPNDLRKPAIQKLASRVTGLSRRTTDLRKELDVSLTGAEMTMWVQLGAAISGAIEAYADDEQVSNFQSAATVLAGIGGVAWGSPEAVAVANGVQAAKTQSWVRNALRRDKTTNQDRA